ncbi:hypothetical protein TNCV_5061971 [Trichonephila clavipes]|nr:hypothetical protein TNCV_5061971 [Trichonephila clavipes]
MRVKFALLRRSVQNSIALGELGSNKTNQTAVLVIDMERFEANRVVEFDGDVISIELWVPPRDRHDAIEVCLVSKFLRGRDVEFGEWMSPPHP